MKQEVKESSGSIVASSSPVANSSGVAEFSYATSWKSARDTYTVEVQSASKSGYSYGPLAPKTSFTLN